MIKYRQKCIKKILTRSDKLPFLKVDDMIKYAGFWVRFGAIVIDTFLILTPITILLGLIFGFDALNEPQKNPQIGLIQVIMYAAIVIFYWVKIGQTPGQKAYGIIIVDETTQKTINYAQALFRFCMYFISLLSIVGLFLPIFRKDKKTLHDIIAHTIVRYVY